jgi:hypothetical protein
MHTIFIYSLAIRAATIAFGPFVENGCPQKPIRCDMKTDLQSNVPLPARMLILVVFILCAASAATPADEKRPEDQLITIDVKNKPLGKVLEELQLSTGTSFSIDIQWKDVPVSVSLNRTPLHEGLARILAKLNSVIIYESNSKIKIFILGKIEPGKAMAGPAGLPRYPPPPGYQQTSPPQISEPEPLAPDETQESETVPDVGKEQATGAESNAVDNGGKAEEEGAADTQEIGSAESKKTEESTTDESGNPSEGNSPDTDGAADKQGGG